MVDSTATDFLNLLPTENLVADPASDGGTHLNIDMTSLETGLLSRSRAEWGTGHLMLCSSR